MDMKENNMKSISKMNKALLSGGIILFLVFTFVGQSTAEVCVPPPSGLVGWWPLDESSGTIASDIIGGNDGIHTNGPTPTAGMVGGGLDFDGLNDYVAFPSAPFFGKPTIDLWIKTTTKSQAIMDGGDRYRTWRIGIDAAGRATYTHFFMPSCCLDYYITITGTTVVADGEFHHIAAVADQSRRTISLYVDGALEASRTPVDAGGWAGSALGYPKLGKNDAQWLPRSYYTGIADELELFDRPLSSAEIEAIYNVGSAGKCKPEPNQPPIAEADFIPIVVEEEDEGHYEIVATATDPDGNLDTVIAVIELPGLEGFDIELKDKKQITIKFNLKNGKIKIDGPDPEALLAEIMEYGGLLVENGQIIRVQASYESKYELKFGKDGTLKIKAPEVTLLVTATDTQGATDTDTANLVSTPEIEW